MYRELAFSVWQGRIVDILSEILNKDISTLPDEQFDFILKALGSEEKIDEASYDQDLLDIGFIESDLKIVKQLILAGKKHPGIKKPDEWSDIELLLMWFPNNNAIGNLTNEVLLKFYSQNFVVINNKIDVVLTLKLWYSNLKIPKEQLIQVGKYLDQKLIASIKQ